MSAVFTIETGVMAGADPAIHRPRESHVSMDRRVKPGDDNDIFCERL